MCKHSLQLPTWAQCRGHRQKLPSPSFSRNELTEYFPRCWQIFQFLITLHMGPDWDPPQSLEFVGLSPLYFEPCTHISPTVKSSLQFLPRRRLSTYIALQLSQLPSEKLDPKSLSPGSWWGLATPRITWNKEVVLLCSTKIFSSYSLWLSTVWVSKHPVPVSPWKGARLHYLMSTAAWKSGFQFACIGEPKDQAIMPGILNRQMGISLAFGTMMGLGTPSTIRSYWEQKNSLDKSPRFERQSKSQGRLIDKIQLLHMTALSRVEVAVFPKRMETNIENQKE